MKKLLIVRTGATYDFIREQHGDFEDCIIHTSGLERDQTTIWTPFEGESAPSLDDVSGIILTGSHAMVSQKAPWSEELAKWIRETAAKRAPILGICYGHQLIAHAFGGEVGYHPKGEEMGTVKISLTAEGKSDSLLKILPDPFEAHVAHAQSVLRLPEGAALLARSDYEPHHAFRLHDQIWGVQFHPEFSAGVVRAYLDKNSEAFSQAGRNVAQMREQIWEHHDGIKLMKRFIELLR